MHDENNAEHDDVRFIADGGVPTGEPEFISEHEAEDKVEKLETFRLQNGRLLAGMSVAEAINYYKAISREKKILFRVFQQIDSEDMQP